MFPFSSSPFLLSLFLLLCSQKANYNINIYVSEKAIGADLFVPPCKGSLQLAIVQKTILYGSTHIITHTSLHIFCNLL